MIEEERKAKAAAERAAKAAAERAAKAAAEREAKLTAAAKGMDWMSMWPSEWPIVPSQL